MDKSPDAFRTISEVADHLETPAHVLRFWESRFPQIKPVKRAGGRRYYRPADVALLSGIKRLLHDEGMTIRGVQKILREQGIRHVASIAGDAADLDAVFAVDEALLDGLSPGEAEAGMIVDAEPLTAEIVLFSAAQRAPDLPRPPAADQTLPEAGPLTEAHPDLTPPDVLRPDLRVAGPDHAGASQTDGVSDAPLLQSRAEESLAAENPLSGAQDTELPDRVAASGPDSSDFGQPDLGPPDAVSPGAADWRKAAARVAETWGHRPAPVFTADPAAFEIAADILPDDGMPLDDAPSGDLRSDTAEVMPDPRPVHADLWQAAGIAAPLAVAAPAPPLRTSAMPGPDADQVLADARPDLPPVAAKLRALSPGALPDPDGRIALLRDSLADLRGRMADAARIRSR